LNGANELMCSSCGISQYFVESKELCRCDGIKVGTMGHSHLNYTCILGNLAQRFINLLKQKCWLSLKSSVYFHSLYF